MMPSPTVALLGLAGWLVGRPWTFVERGLGEKKGEDTGAPYA